MKVKVYLNNLDGEDHSESQVCRIDTSLIPIQFDPIYEHANGLHRSMYLMECLIARRLIGLAVMRKYK